MQVQVAQEPYIGCCGAVPRQGIVPPNTGPPDTHKVNVLWYLGFALLYLASIIAYGIFGYYGNILFYPLVFTTIFVIYALGYKRLVQQHRINSQRTRLPDLFRAFAQSFFSAGMLALLIELVISLLILIVFGVSDSRLAKDLSDGEFSGDKSTFGAHLYYFLQAFFVAGLIEEYCKGFLLQYCMKLYIYHRKYLNNLDIETIVWLGLSVGSGFGTMEGVLYTCFYGGGTSLLSQFILWLVRVLVAIPFHTTMGVMWGCELAKRDALKYDSIADNIGNNNNNNINMNSNNSGNNYTGFKAWFKLGIKQVMWHGCYDFIEMEFSLLTASNNTSEEIEMAIIGCIIAIIITILAAVASWRTYKRITSTSRSELIPDEPHDDHL